MPYVRVEITDGATTEQKRAISKGITDVLVKVLNKNPEYTFVVIDEVIPTTGATRASWSPTSARKRRRPQPRRPSRPRW